MLSSLLDQLPVIPEWAKAGTAESTIILSTRVRFARNLKGENFPLKLDTEGRVRVLQKICRVLHEYEQNDEGVFFSLPALKREEINLLIERRAISPQLAKSDSPRGVLVWKEHDRSLMICEEDHLRLAEIQPGQSARKCHDNLLPILYKLSEQLDFAFDNSLGFLSASPANLGLAMRMSLFCHLPALVMTKGMDKVAASVADAGFTVRGFWGEGSDILGNTFQLTDGPALSFTPVELLQRLENLADEVTEREALARIELQSQNPLLLKDKIARTVATLKSCKLLSAHEAFLLLSSLRLGVDIGFVEGVSRTSISLLNFELGPAYLEWNGIGNQSAIPAQEYRAKRVHEEFSQARFVA